MITNRYLTKLICAAMAAAVCLCLLAVAGSRQLVEALGGKAVSVEYESGLFETGQVMQVDIQMGEAEWEAMLSDALAEEYVSCDVTINGEQLYRVGIRPKGNTSLTSIAMDPDTDRYSLKLEFDHYVEGQTCMGLDKLVLNNNFADATNMKEAVVYDMYHYLGADASLCSYARVSVNGEYLGVYLALEAVEDSFLLRNYGTTSSGKLYKPEGMDGGRGREGADGEEEAFRGGNEGIPGEEGAFRGGNEGIPGEEGAFRGRSEGIPGEEGAFGGRSEGIPVEEGAGEGESPGRGRTGMGEMPEEERAEAEGSPEGEGARAGEMPEEERAEAEGLPDEEKARAGEMPEEERAEAEGSPEGARAGEMPKEEMFEEPGGFQGESGNASDDGKMPSGEPSEGEGELFWEVQPDDGISPGDMHREADGFPGEMPGGDRLSGEGFPGGGRGFSDDFGGADLNYTDDDLESYSVIWEGEVTDSGKSDHRRVITALKYIAEGTQLEEYLDVENVLKYMAVHTFVVNLDSLSGNMPHNYYLYESGGMLNLIPWDYNLSFGGMGAGRSGNATEVINDAIDTPFPGIGFFDALLENEEYRAQYHEYLRMLAEEYVGGGVFEETYIQFRTQIDELVKTDPTAFYSYEEYEAGAEMLYQTVALRAESVLGQLNGEIPSTDDEQRADPSRLLDASEIDLNVMGTFGAF